MVKTISISRHVQAALEQARYQRDENGVIVAHVPGASGFFSQGETLEEARYNLRSAGESFLSAGM